MVVSGDPDVICYLGVLGNSYLYQRLHSSTKSRFLYHSLIKDEESTFQSDTELLFISFFCSEETCSEETVDCVLTKTAFSTI